MKRGIPNNIPWPEKVESWAERIAATMRQQGISKYGPTHVVRHVVTDWYTALHNSEPLSVQTLEQLLWEYMQITHYYDSAAPLRQQAVYMTGAEIEKIEYIGSQLNAIEGLHRGRLKSKSGINRVLVVLFAMQRFIERHNVP